VGGAAGVSELSACAERREPILKASQTQATDSVTCSAVNEKMYSSLKYRSMWVGEEDRLATFDFSRLQASRLHRERILHDL
jgi:hypothetical protein